MFFLSRKYRKMGLNRHVFTIDDARRLCDEHNVEIIECDIDQDGFYVKFQGKPQMYVKRNLPPLKWLYVVLHELGHHILHASGYMNVAFFCHDSQDTKQHHEAEAFTLIAMMPEPFLRRLLAGDLLNELEDYPADLVKNRLRILDLYGI